MARGMSPGHKRNKAMKREIYFFRPGVDLSKLVLDKSTGYLNETIEIEGLGRCVIFGNGKWTAIKPVQKPTKTRK